MSHFFTVKQLTVGYDNQPLIRDINIELERGKILTLIGPNGSGKSTILKSITRHLKQISGTVYIDGRAIDTMTNKELSRRIAVVLTERLRTELMTCEDVVATGRYPYTGMLGVLDEADRRQVRAAMELAQAWPLRERDFTEISDGQRQRVLLARAICQQPQIIVLDEPTSFLDARYSLELLHTLRMLAEEQGVTVIMSLHELDMAQKVSDLVMCVKGAYITDIGTPRQIFCRERISALYDLEDGSYNPLFGSFELARPAGAPAVFVIAGNGGGVAEYRALQKRRIPFATGVLHENDVDYQVARDLATIAVAERSFTPIRAETFAAARQAMLACRAVVNCLDGYGPLNEKNRALLDIARQAGMRLAENADAV